MNFDITAQFRSQTCLDITNSKRTHGMLLSMKAKMWRLKEGRENCHRRREIRRKIEQLEKQKSIPLDQSQSQSQSQSSSAPAPAATSPECPTCCITLRRQPKFSTLICDQCGHTQQWYDTSYNAVDYNEDIEFTSFSYRRHNHFSEWLAVSQGKENTDIPRSVLTQIMEKLHDMRLFDPEKITKNDIRSALKKLKLRRYYENSTAILCLLNGKPPPRFSPNQENLLKTMFKRIQLPFERTCPSDRSNFLSYSYIMFKFCELLNLPQKSNFSLLKGAHKLYKQDQMWKNICKELNWKYIESI